MKAKLEEDWNEIRREKEKKGKLPEKVKERKGGRRYKQSGAGWEASRAEWEFPLH